jgi:hypothetical protein
MTKTAGPFPRVSLPGIDASAPPIGEDWSSGPALLLIGHSDCPTTRETLLYLDRIHRRRTRGTATAILQDDVAAARDLVRELGLELPIRLELDPYALAAAVDLVTVPTIFAVNAEGEITTVSEGLSRADLESFASRLGVEGALFGPEDTVPALRPG